SCGQETSPGPPAPAEDPARLLRPGELRGPPAAPERELRSDALEVPADAPRGEAGRTVCRDRSQGQGYAPDRRDLQRRRHGADPGPAPGDAGRHVPRQEEAPYGEGPGSARSADPGREIGRASCRERV